jgi:hypothetical protein
MDSLSSIILRQIIRSSFIMIDLYLKNVRLFNPNSCIISLLDLNSAKSSLNFIFVFPTWYQSLLSPLTPGGINLLFHRGSNWCHNGSIRDFFIIIFFFHYILYNIYYIISDFEFSFFKKFSGVTVFIPFFASAL